MSGLFVRKHAQAVVRQGVEVDVLSIYNAQCIMHNEIEDKVVEGVREVVIYTNKGGVWGEVQAIKQLWQYWHKFYGKPDVVHVNVLTKQGLLARWLQVNYNIPFVVMEHWSGYLPENGNYRGFMRKTLSQMILSHAKAIMPVSSKLMNAMKQCGLRHANWQIVPNVVDDFFYNNDTTSRVCKDKFRFIHVSCFDNRAKNTLAIVEAVEKLSKQRNDFEMIMVGTGQDIFFTRCLADNYKLESRGFIQFTGEQTPQQVKEWMDASDCFVLFSNYETAAVVLEEAAACGLPIISTPVGIAEELQITDYRLQITEGDSGLLVPIGEVNSLTKAMSAMIDNANKFDKEKIKERAAKYSFDRVGHQLIEIYKRAISD
jgi:glycosyltransferase involved in cell wall biosynthesis